MNRLTSTEKALCAVYGILGVIGLVGTQVVLFGGYVSSADGSLVDQMVANGAATFMLIDLLAVAIIALVFMVAEGRRIGMRFLWVYVLLTFLVAISVSLPLFLIVRQVHLAKERAGAEALTNR
jgi:hypothetical protein